MRTRATIDEHGIYYHGRRYQHPAFDLWVGEEASLSMEGTTLVVDVEVKSTVRYYCTADMEVTPW